MVTAMYWASWAWLLVVIFAAWLAGMLEEAAVWMLVSIPVTNIVLLRMRAKALRLERKKG